MASMVERAWLSLTGCHGQFGVPNVEVGLQHRARATGTQPQIEQDAQLIGTNQVGHTGLPAQPGDGHLPLHQWQHGHALHGTKIGDP